jgi:tripartite-type tricarboxylate transporter receptor subunit TctC
MLKMRRRILGALLASLVIAPAAAVAQEFPSRTIMLVVPWPAGGVVDAAARTIGEKLAVSLGRPVVIDNKPGAAGKVGTDYVKRAEPDGHTLLVVTASHATTAALSEKLPFDPIADFTAVSFTSQFPAVLVANRQLGVSNLQELVAISKTKPDKLNYGSAGLGSPAHLLSEMFRQKVGMEMVHVPYRGAPQAMQDLVAGRIDVLFANLNVALPMVASGQVTPIGVTGPDRTPEIPDVPSLSAAGATGFVDMQWLGFIGPKGMKPEVVNKLNAAINEVLAQPDVRESLKRQGMQPVGGAPEKIMQIIKDDIAKWQTVVQTGGIKVTE